MKKALMLVFVPSPGVGHLVPAVEIAKRMVEQDDHLFIRVLVMKSPFSDSKTNNYVESVTASFSSSLYGRNIQFINLPCVDQQTAPAGNPISSLVESQKPHVKDSVSRLLTTHDQDDDIDPTNSGSAGARGSPQLAGFVVGMFCTTMIDVANDFGVPSYIFFASSAASLGLMLYMQSLNDDQNFDTTEFKDSDAEFLLPSFKNPVPARVLPSVVFNKAWHDAYYGNARRFKETKGIIINTFAELESKPINSFGAAGDGLNCSNNNLSPVVLYPIGPVLNMEGQGLQQHDPNDPSFDQKDKNKDIMEWLDSHPPLSVVFLCFGSMGSFNEDQVKEIACALESSGHRFLWSLRLPPPKGKMGFPTDYANAAGLEQVLPQEFLERTVKMTGRGKIIGWAPQVAILAHPAIGGFVSHCGWNSILESLWFGIPIAAWPLFSEQQLNAFEMIVDLGLATEIKMDYRKDFSAATEMIVSAACIERGIRSVMEPDSEIREKVKEISEMSRKAFLDGGSSSCTFSSFITDVRLNVCS